MPEKKADMSSAVNWHDEISTIAGTFDGNRKGWLSRAARKADTTYRQVKALYYGESKNPRHSVAVKILSAADQARIEEARRDGEKLARIYQNMARVDEDFYRIQIDAFIAALRDGGSADST